MKSKYLFKYVASLCVAFLLGAVIPAFAQNKLTGKVADEDGNPLEGVFVSVTGTENATVTSADGSFSLNAPASAESLTFSMLGFEDNVEAIGNKNVFSVIMREDTQMLEETVVVGYGSMIKRELTASVSQIDGAELTQRASSANVLQAMAGKMAGVKITQTSGRPGGESQIRVRGFGSVNASSSPLFVVDGVVDVDYNSINSADIETITVLKDAASASIYGAQGANGVVLITTKSGKAESGTVTYDGKVGVGFLSRKIDMMNSNEYLQMQQMAYAYSGQNMPHLVTPYENLFYYKKDDAGNFVYDENGLLIASPIYDTDWVNECTRNAITQDHNLSFSKSTDKSHVYANIGYQDVQGLVKTTYSKRLSATINADTEITKWLNLNGRFTFSQHSYNTADNETTMTQGAIRNMAEMPPIVPVQYPDGTWGNKQDYPLSESASNPIQQLQYMSNVTTNSYVNGSMGLLFKLAEGLTLDVKGNIRVTNIKNTDTRRAGLINYSDASAGNAQAYWSTNRQVRWQNEDYLTYDKRFFDNKLHSNFVLGASWYSSEYLYGKWGMKDLANEKFGVWSMDTGTTKTNASSDYSKQTMNSYYFRTSQDFLGRYMLGITLRVDGASNFGAKSKYGFFPSVSAGWMMSEEPWFADAKNAINMLKIRASYGEVGNSTIGNFVTQSKIGSGTTFIGGSMVSSAAVSTLGNSDLTWETSKQFDVGIDLAFCHDRIQVIADFYLKRTVDLLFSESIPRTSGFSSLTSNLGTLRNTGFELTLNTHPIDGKNFKWDLDFIYYTNKCIVEKLYGTLSNHGGQCQEGEEYMRWGAKKLLGTWSTEEAYEASLYGRTPGDYKLEDVNGDYKYDDEDTQYLGSPVPKAEFSLVNNFNYKGINLMIDMGAAVGFKVYSYSQGLYVGQAIYTNSYASVLNAAWTPDNQNTRLAMLRLPTDAYFGNGNMGDFCLQPGDYLRIRNITLSYDFKNIMKNVKVIKSLIVGVSAENPFLFTKYKGYDPECGWGSGDTNLGMDWYSYPKPTTISGNVKISF